MSKLGAKPSSKHYRKPHVHYCQLVNSRPGQGKRSRAVRGMPPQTGIVVRPQVRHNAPWWAGIFERLFGPRRKKEAP